MNQSESRLHSGRSVHFHPSLSPRPSFRFSEGLVPRLGRISDQEPRNGAIKRSRTIFTDQDSWSRSQTLLQATCMLLLLDLAVYSN